jgi:type IV pilus biogenesis protein CpaD/CtpE
LKDAVAARRFEQHKARTADADVVSHMLEKGGGADNEKMKVCTYHLTCRATGEALGVSYVNCHSKIAGWPIPQRHKCRRDLWIYL